MVLPTNGAKLLSVSLDKPHLSIWLPFSRLFRYLSPPQELNESASMRFIMFLACVRKLFQSTEFIAVDKEASLLGRFASGPHSHHSVNSLGRPNIARSAGPLVSQ